MITAMVYSYSAASQSGWVTFSDGTDAAYFSSLGGWQLSVYTADQLHRRYDNYQSSRKELEVPEELYGKSMRDMRPLGINHG